MSNVTAPTEPSPWTIRDATVADADQIASLLVSIGWFSGLKGMTLSELTTTVTGQLRVLTATDSSSTWVAESANGDVVGYSNVHWLTDLFMPGPEGYLSELFLRPEVRGRGLGRAFLRAIETEARHRGAYRLSLLNGRHRESYERGFYEQNGWEERVDMANFVSWVRPTD
jgi:GNAT superfamily N-acetyltransferase